jgi:hypothetical protein
MNSWRGAFNQKPYGLKNRTVSSLENVGLRTLVNVPCFAMTSESNRSAIDKQRLDCTPGRWQIPRPIRECHGHSFTFFLLHRTLGSLPK